VGGDGAVASVVSECEEVGWVIRGDFHRFRDSRRALIIRFMAHYSFYGAEDVVLRTGYH
jgi:hypothetical protein